MLRSGISGRDKSGGCPLASAAPAESRAFPLSEQSTRAELRAGDCGQVSRGAKGALVGKHSNQNRGGQIGK